MILIIDDNADTADLLVRLLRRAGMAAVTESSGSAALAYLRDEERADLPRLIILDVSMPVMDGISCLRTIRAEPTWAGVPVIMYTADHSLDRMNEALRCGAAGYVVKGVARWDDFLSLIRQHAQGDGPDLFH